MKKTFAILLALVMMLSMSAMAASITIDPNIPEGGTDAGNATYNAYLIFTATYEGDTPDGNVSYVIANDSPYKAAIEKYFELDSIAGTTNSVVTAKENYNTEAAKALAAELAAIAKDQTPTGAVSGKNADGNYVITGLEKGYYLVTSTVGDALILDTTTDDVIVTKNSYPSLDKVLTTEITEGTVDMGTVLDFKIEVKIPATAVGEIVVHDKMTGLEYVSWTRVEGITETKAPTKTENGEDIPEGCAVHFTLTADYVATNKGKTVTINYKAKVVADYTKNEAWLVDDNYTSKPDDPIETHSYDIEVYKFEMKNGAETGLEGAGFILKNAEGKFYNWNNGVVTWVDEANATELKPVADTYTVTFTGLANGTYTLIEKTVPTGYNRADDKDIVVKDADWTGATKVEVENKTGTELPSTGGMGTTIFYVVGGLMVAAAVVALVAKKKVSAK